MQSNAEKIIELVKLLERSLKESNEAQANDYLVTIDKILRSLSEEELAAEEELFISINQNMIEINQTYTKNRDVLKKQLFQLKNNSKKLKAYSK